MIFDRSYNLKTIYLERIPASLNHAAKHMETRFLFNSLIQRKCGN